MEKYPEEWPQFFTATIKEWKPLLEDDLYKDILIDSLRFLVDENRIFLNAFVIMKNHAHFIWQSRFGHTQKKTQESFMKFTAQQMKFNLKKNNQVLLEEYKVEAFDRDYNFWKRRSLGIELFSPAVFQQKMDYIHNNPVKAGLCINPEDYYYSSAKFYLTGKDDFNIIDRFQF